MRRREFITLLCGVTVAWPFAARAQQTDRVRRIGELENKAANDPEAPKEMTALLGGLQERGWTFGGNLQIEYRWGAGDVDLHRKYAAKLVALAPDVKWRPTKSPATAKVEVEVETSRCDD